MKIKAKAKEFKVGDKIRIKSCEEIKQYLDRNDRAYDGIYFNPGMEKCTNSYDTIKAISDYNGYKIYYVYENSWTWSSKWLEHEK